MLKHSLIALAAMGAGLIGLSVTEASAFTATPQQPALQTESSTLLTDVRHRRDGRGRHWDRWDRRYHGDRCGRYSRHCRHYHRGYYYENPWWVLPMIGAGIALSTRGYDRYDGYGSRHVEWCLDRYRSYNPRSNTWVSYSGRVHQCISPYGP